MWALLCGLAMFAGAYLLLDGGGPGGSRQTGWRAGKRGAGSAGSSGLFGGIVGGSRSAAPGDGGGAVPGGTGVAAPGGSAGATDGGSDAELSAGGGLGRGDASGPLSGIRQAFVGLARSPAVRKAIERERTSRLAAVCEKEMPELLDILALGLSAGLSFDASLELYCERRQGPLSREVWGAMSLWRVGVKSRSEALEELAGRVGSPSLERFCAAVREALSFGSPLAQTLERQADAIRAEQRSLTEERIEKVPVRMLVPLGTLVVPAMLLAILGPLLAGALAM